MASSLPIGFGFYPRDEELVQYFLPRMQRNDPIPGDFIKVAAVYDDHPSIITAAFHPANRSPEWFFFHKSKKKANQSRAPRSAGLGTWKSSQAIKDLRDKDGEIIGTKQSFAYHDKLPSGNPKYKKSDLWLMEEFVSAAKTDDNWVICKIYWTPEARRKAASDKTAMAVQHSDEQLQQVEFDQGNTSASATTQDQNLATVVQHDEQSSGAAAMSFFDQLPDLDLGDYQDVFN